MKKILFVCDYASWNWISQGEGPSQHLFGLHECITKYVQHNGELRGLLPDGYVDFYLIKREQRNFLINKLMLIIQCLHIWLLSFQYDVIYDVICQCTKILCVPRRLRIMRSRLVTICHHPPFNFIFQVGCADAYIFFTKSHYDYARKYFPKYKTRMFLNEWGFDKKFYVALREEPKHAAVFFIDNGKTGRDAELMDKVFADANYQCYSPYPNINGLNLLYYASKRAKTFLSYLLCAQAMIIPISKLHLPNTYKRCSWLTRMMMRFNDSFKIPLDPCGMTSFMDAVACHMPVICSDNTTVAELVTTYRLGVVYRGGDDCSLKAALDKLYTDKSFFNECQYNMALYAEQHDMKHYSQRLCQILAYVGI